MRSTSATDGWKSRRITHKNNWEITMNTYTSFLNEKELSALKTLVGKKCFYIRFPFVNISDCIEFESGEMYVYNENEKYELNIKSRWKETEIDWIDYGDILLDLRELKVGNSSLNLHYEENDPDRKSAVYFPATEIKYVSVYQFVFEGKNDTVIYDSHLVIGLENKKVMVFDFHRDISERILLTITDEDDMMQVIEKHDFIGEKGKISERVTFRG